jgi:hypothetical protein
MLTFSVNKQQWQPVELHEGGFQPTPESIGATGSGVVEKPCCFSALTTFLKRLVFLYFTGKII